MAPWTLLALVWTAAWAVVGYGYDDIFASIPLTPDGMTARYLMPDLVPGVPLAKRDGSCGDGRHPCLDTHHSDRCCENTQYCYVNRVGLPRCCPIGSNCINDSSCQSTAYQCTTDITITTTAAGGTVGPLVLSSQVGCCSRRCPRTSQYLCADDLGGKCCPYGAECRSDGNCVSTRTASTSVPAKLTPVPDGCTTSQHKCADGTGCCDLSMHCTEVTGTAYCAPTDAHADNAARDGDTRASVGVAIGVGVGLGGGLSVGAAAWLCLARRRKRRRRASKTASLPMAPPGERGADPSLEMAELSEAAASPSSPLDRSLTEPLSAMSGLSPEFHSAGPAATPGPRWAGAVSPAPLGVNAVAAPVVMDLTTTTTTSQAAQVTPETIEGRFELYGCSPAHSSP
ncbi:hypothetical protein DCS_01577 [Drechmeria coniospora]|uniref:Uncharacterized protein n=1 Tax=Drechmeria coniospora TaxID=98403 RepID=A0A151GTN5_DRECN|nr:hypothetical protein DCS_01577 [Drechmeria coniospora]KYK60440.1 hypothetical protein DCS_01577 [Drechmeria coniospora]